MSFWGVEVKWGETVEVDPSDWPADQLHISQATLWQEGDQLGRIGVRVTVVRDEAEEDPRGEEEIENDEEDAEGEEKEEDYLFVTKEELFICSLKKETQESSSLDLVFSEAFALELVCQGPIPEGLSSAAASVHLSGYYMPGEVMGTQGINDPGEDEESEEEEEEEEEPQELDEDDLRQVLERKRLENGMAKIRRQKLGSAFGFGDEFVFGEDEDDDDEDEDEDGDAMDSGQDAVFANTNLTSVRIVEVTELDAVSGPQTVEVNGVLESAQVVVEEPDSPLATAAPKQDAAFTDGPLERGEVTEAQVGDAGTPKDSPASTDSAKKKQKKKKTGLTPAKSAQEAPPAPAEEVQMEAQPEAQAEAGGESSATPQGDAAATAEAKGKTAAAKKVVQGQQKKEKVGADKAKVGKGLEVVKEAEKKKGQQLQKAQDTKQAAKEIKQVAKQTGKEAAKGKAGKKAAPGTEAAAPATKPAGDDKEAGESAADADVEDAKNKKDVVGSKRSGAEENVDAVKKPKVKRTFPNGLELEELALGKPDAKVAKRGKTILVRYTGKLKKTGEVFDSNVTAKTPFKFRLGIGEVIKGWDVGLEGMRVGDKRRLTIPPTLGYGYSGHPPKIPPNAILLFDVELVDVK